jgi:hypothetical protein
VRGERLGWEPGKESVWTAIGGRLERIWRFRARNKANIAESGTGTGGTSRRLLASVSGDAGVAASFAVVTSLSLSLRTVVIDTASAAHFICGFRGGV